MISPPSHLGSKIKEIKICQLLLSFWYIGKYHRTLIEIIKNIVRANGRI